MVSSPAPKSPNILSGMMANTQELASCPDSVENPGWEPPLPFPSQTLASSKVKNNQVGARLSAHCKVSRSYERDSSINSTLQMRKLRYRGGEGSGESDASAVSQTGREHGGEGVVFLPPA